MENDLSFCRKILFISPVPTHPQNAGNRTRVATLLSTLKDLGHDVHFLFIGQESGDIKLMTQVWGPQFSSVSYQLPRTILKRLQRRFQRLTRSPEQYCYDIDDWYDPSLDDELVSIQRKEKFEVVIVSYVFFSRALNIFDDKVTKIIDTHDAFADRHLKYLAKGETPVWFSTSNAGERKAFDRADIIFAIQEKEQKLFSGMTDKKVVTLGHTAHVKYLDPALAKKLRILFVASDNNINVHGIRFFIDKVLPIVQRELPEVELALAGSVCGAVADRHGIVKLGRVDDLTDAYRSAALVINPVLFNTGVSIKNLEALGFGKPLITATVGTEGLESGEGVAYLVADTAEDFAARTLDILQNTNLRLSLSQKSIAYVQQCNQDIVNCLQAALR